MQPKPEFLNPDDFPEPHMESAARVSEAERLAQEIDGERYGDVAAELRRLAAEVEALRADAERYRWLAANARSTSEHWGGRWSLVIDGPAPMRHDCEDALDAAIDAAKASAA